MLGKLIDALQTVGIDFDGESLADALWLAHQVRDGAHFDTRTPPVLPAAELAPAPTQSYEQAVRSDPEPDAPSTPVPGAATALRAPDAALPAGREGAMRLPAPRALRDDLSAALGPLARRDPRPGLVIDVEASVDAYAASGIWTERYAEGDRRWLRATLIVDAGPQAPLWQSTLDEFAQMLRERGAFRSVRRKELILKANGEALLREPWATGGTDALRSVWSRDEVLLVASDFVATAWPAAFGRCIERWRDGNHVMLLHLLPSSLWGRTWTGMPDLLVSGQVPGGDGDSLLAFARKVRHGRKHAPALPQPVPVIGLTPDDLRGWSQVVVAEAGRALAIDLTARLGAPQGIASANMVRTPDSLVRAFKGNASSLCIKLGTYLSLTAPLTFQMMQWVQQAMVRDASTAELAEFFLSGLIQKKYGAARSADVVYDFVPGVRELLERGITTCEAADVHRAIGVKLELHCWNDGKEGSLVDVEVIAGRTDAPLSVRMFAQVSAGYLQRLRAARGAAKTAPAEPSFLTKAQVAARVRQSIAHLDYIVEQLLLFSTPTQQTWLVFCTNTLVIVLDDDDTRGRRKEIQALLPMADALVANPTIDADGNGTVGFTGYKDRWYYSRELFEEPEALRNAFGSAVAAVHRRRELHYMLMKAAAYSSGLGKFSAGTPLYLTIRPPRHGRLTVPDVLAAADMIPTDDGRSQHLLHASLSAEKLQSLTHVFDERTGVLAHPSRTWVVRISIQRMLRLLDISQIYDGLQHASDRLPHETWPAFENETLLFIERQFKDIDGVVWRPREAPDVRRVCMLAERLANDLQVDDVNESASNSGLGIVPYEQGLKNLAMGRYEDAINDFTQNINDPSTQPAIQAASRYNRALANTQLGDMTAAMQDYLHILDQSDAHPDLARATVLNLSSLK